MKDTYHEQLDNAIKENRTMNNKVKTSDLIGEIEGFPLMIVQRMCDYQVAQGNRFDVTVFQEYKSETNVDGGFDWRKTPEGYDFWRVVITERNFSLYFERYPYEPRMMEVSDYEDFRDTYLRCVIRIDRDGISVVNNYLEALEDIVLSMDTITYYQYARFPQPKKVEEMTLSQVIAELGREIKIIKE